MTMKSDQRIRDAYEVRQDEDYTIIPPNEPSMLHIIQMIRENTLKEVREIIKQTVREAVNYRDDTLYASDDAEEMGERILARLR